MKNIERLRWRYHDLWRWLFCCLYFRLYPVLPRSLQVYWFNKVVGPFYRIIEDEVPGRLHKREGRAR
jgi:hypothetical protein